MTEHADPAGPGRTLHPRPSVPDPQPWAFPLSRRLRLANGMQVLLLDLPGQHLATVQLVLDLPLTAEPADQEGIASLLLRSCDEGTRAHPGSLLQELVEGAGATIDGYTEADATSCVLTVPTTRLGQALPLLAEVFAAPELASTDVDRQRELRLAEIDRTLADPNGLAGLAFRAAVFDASSRFSRPDGGRRACVAGLDAAQLADFHARAWCASRATLILAGELPPDTAEVVQRVFGALPAGTGCQTLQRLEPVAAPTPRLLLLDRPGAVQAVLRIGQVGPDRTHPDWPVLQVAADAIGGSFGSRLNHRLREELGYTYGVHAGFAPLRRAGTFSLTTSCRTEVAVDACQQALDLLDLTAAPLGRQEVHEAVNHLIGVAPLRCEAASGVARQAAALTSAGLSTEWLADYHRRIRECTPDQAGEAFSRHVQPAAMSIVLVGAAAALEPGLRAAGHTPEVVRAEQLG